MIFMMLRKNFRLNHRDDRQTITSHSTTAWHLMICAHVPGFPRIGEQRELKFALERHWRGEISEDELEAIGRGLRQRHWQMQRDAGLDFVTVGDFAFYDHVANHI